MTPSPAGSAQPFDPRSLYSSSSSSTSAPSPNKVAAGAAASVSPASNGPTTKREQGTPGGEDVDSSPGAGVGAGGKKKPSKRRKVNLACIYCRRSHMTCDEGRPCQRCIKRDIGHLCHDEATPAKAPHDTNDAGTTATPSKSTTQASASVAASTTEAAAIGPSSTPSTSTASLPPPPAIATNDAASFFPKLGMSASGSNDAAAGNSNTGAAFGGGSSGPYSSVSPMSSLNQNNNQEFNAANIFKPQVSVNTNNAQGGFGMQQTASGSGVTAAGMLSLASLFQSNINHNNAATSNTATQTTPGINTGVAGNQSDMSGLGSAGWLGLGGGPGGYEGGGSGFGGDSAGGNEFTLLSEFLESLDGPGFGAGATPGMTGTAAMSGTGSGSGFTPTQSRRNTISGLTPFTSNAGMTEGLTALTPLNNSNTSNTATNNTSEDTASGGVSRTSLPTLPSIYDSTSSASGGTGFNNFNNAASSSSSSFGPSGNSSNNANSNENGVGKRSRRSSFSAATTTSASASGQNSGIASGSYLPSLQGGSSKTERFFLTAADQKDGTRDERLARVIQAKYEAGLLRPYNHVNGYARLNRWMERNVSAASKRRILKPLSVFRPAFRAVAQSLTNIDLIFIEEAFERLLLDYDRVFSTQGIPACLWRRTGEIYKGNKEFAELVGVPIESLREGRLCIYELMAEESAVNYWEKYGAVSFDPGQKAVLTSCVLRTKNKAIVAGGSVSGTAGSAAKGENGKATHAINAQLPRSATASGQITPNLASDSSKELKDSKEDAGDKPNVVAAGTGATSTSGVLKDPNNPKAAFIHCCFSFTIRRDQWNIPHMIVGNFLPTNPP